MCVCIVKREISNNKQQRHTHAQNLYQLWNETPIKRAKQEKSSTLFRMHATLPIYAPRSKDWMWCEWVYGAYISLRTHNFIFFSVRVCIASFALVLAWLIRLPLLLLLLLRPQLLPILVLLSFCFCHFVKTIDLLFVLHFVPNKYYGDSFMPNFMHASRVHIRTRQQ